MSATQEIVKKIAKQVLGKTAKQTKPQRHGSTSQTKSFARQLFEPSLEDEFKVLLAGEGSPDPHILDADVFPWLASKPQDILQEETGKSEPTTDAVTKLRQQWERSRRKDSRKITGTFPENGEWKRDEPEKPPVVMPFPSPTVPELPPKPTPDVPTPPVIITPDWPGIDITRDEDLPVPTEDVPEPEQDEPMFKKDVYDCQEAQRIARMFGLPEPICGRTTGASLVIRGRL